MYENDKEPTYKDWEKLYSNPVYNLMVSAGAMDTIEFKENMEIVYSKKNIQQKNNEEINLHKKYKEHEEELKHYLEKVKHANVVDSLTTYLYPFLPERLKDKSFLPVSYYVFYGKEEATGGPGMVVIDFLLSFKIDSYKFGILSAHEAFHSIVTLSFYNKLKPNNNPHDPNLILLEFLSNLSQEGIADLIDKPHLSLPDSPLLNEIQILKESEEQLSIYYIKKLDSLLSQAHKSGHINLNFRILSNEFSKNGGHIPGRFMGQVIASTNYLYKHIPNIEDPISFILIYSEAVKRYHKKMPSFSKESLKYLKDLKKIYYSEL